MVVKSGGDYFVFTDLEIRRREEIRKIKIPNLDSYGNIKT